ncbi:MAG: hypothetical protein L6R28_03570 [Planctomycetes bacterium]|nr:hypothetical protein [Planctomycetota bacterium]
MNRIATPIPNEVQRRKQNDRHFLLRMLFYISAGNVLLYALFLREHPDLPAAAAALALCMGALAAFVSLQLWKFSREEPADLRARVRFGELAGIAVLLGGYLAVYHAQRPEAFLAGGLPTGAVLGALLYFAVASASRHRFVNAWARYPYALATAVSLFGRLGWGSLLVFFFLFRRHVDGSAFKITHTEARVLGAAVISWPLGEILRAVVHAKWRQPPPPAEPSPKAPPDTQAA